MTETSKYPKKDEFSLLDQLKIIVENLRLLVIGPVLAGLIAFAVALGIPKTYKSTALIKSEQNLAAQTLTDNVLDPIAAKLGYTPKMEADDARDKLKKEIKVTYNAKDKLLTLSTEASIPQAAQALANDVLAQVYLQSQPRDSAKQSLQKQLIQLQTRENELTQSAKILERRLEQATGNGVSEVAQGYALLISVIEKTQENQIKIEKELKGIDSSDLIQSPTLPTKKVAPNLSFIAFFATLAVGFGLLIFVFIRQALLNASQNQESIQKINSVKAAWRKALGKKA